MVPVVYRLAVNGHLRNSERELIESTQNGITYTGNLGEPVRAEVLSRVLEESSAALRAKGLRLRAVRVSGTLDLSNRDVAVGLDLHSCQLDEVEMADARVPWLRFRNVKFSGAVDLRRSATSADVIFNDHCQINCRSPLGALQLQSARIGGDFFVDGARLINTSGPAINAYQSAVVGTAEIGGVIVPVARGELGALIFTAARIGGSLRFHRFCVVNDAGYGIRIDSARVENHLILKEVDVSSCKSGVSPVEARGVSVEGGFFLTDSRLRSSRFVALAAGESTFHGPCHITSSQIVGSGIFGAMNLDGLSAASILVDGCDFVNHDGPAIMAEGMDIKGAIAILRSTLSGKSEDRGSMDIAYSRAPGGISFEGTKSRNIEKRGHAVDLRVVTSSRVHLPASLACRSGGSIPSTWATDGSIDLDHFSYSSLSRDDPGVDQWLQWLSLSPRYAAYPYQRLASVYRDSGQEAVARRILIAQQDTLLRRRINGMPSWNLGKRILRLTLGYGYQTWRAFVGLLIVVTLSVLMSVAAGNISHAPGGYVVSRTIKSTQPGTQCSFVERIGLGIDRSLPILNTGSRERCDIDSTSLMGQSVTVVSWLLQLAAWALMTLVIVSYTGLVRKL